MVIFLNEENRELSGRLFPIPDGIMKHLKQTLSTYEKKDGDKNNKGYDHLKWMTGQERLSMEELKRIKHFFDNYEGTKLSDDYKLYGGREMCDWVNATIEHATKTVKNNKKALKDAGLSNTEKKEHTKTETAKPGKPATASKKAKEFSTALNETKHYIVLSEKQIQRYLKTNNE